MFTLENYVYIDLGVTMETIIYLLSLDIAMARYYVHGLGLWDDEAPGWSQKLDPFTERPDLNNFWNSYRDR